MIGIQMQHISKVLKSVVVCLVLSMGVLSISTIDAQTTTYDRTFELAVPGTESVSIARVTADELAIRDSTGTVTRYQRLPRYDTTDQQLIGYASRQAHQVIRWPVDDIGRMQIGTLRNGQVEFAWSKMTIGQLHSASTTGGPSDVLPPGMDETHIASRTPTRALGSGGSTANAASSLMNLPQMTAMQLSVGEPNSRQFLLIEGGNQLGLSPQTSSPESAWYISPVSNNVVRLQQRSQNQWLAIGLDSSQAMPGALHRLGNQRLGGVLGSGGVGFRSANGSMSIALSPIGNDAEQLWRIQNVVGGNGYCFESVLYPGMGLTYLPGQGLTLQPIIFDPWQVWSASPSNFATSQSQFRTVQRQVVPNQPLRPSSARIANTHSDAVMVLIADRRISQPPQKLRIVSGSGERVQLDRDAGSTVIETVETMDAFGNWQQQQWSTFIPPSVLYDISVYEEFLQSIAIDRTGKSPNPIEDINYQPRSVGFFLVPPGDEVPEFAEIDAYRIAVDAQNPGAVRRLNQQELKQSDKTPTTDPLKDLLNQFQKQRAAF